MDDWIDVKNGPEKTKAVAGWSRATNDGERGGERGAELDETERCKKRTDAMTNWPGEMDRGGAEVEPSKDKPFLALPA